MASFAKRKVHSLDEMASPKKRKKSGSPEPASNSTAGMKDDFTAVHFKFMLRENKDTAVEGLEKFIKASSSGDYDIIKDYVTSSLECQEIFAWMEKRILKPNELALVFQVFEKILLHIATKEELEDYFSVGKHIVTTLLTSYMSNIMFALNMKSKSAHIKAALKLLTAMVMLGSMTATLVLNNMNFGDSTITSLFERRDVQDKEDARTCLLHLIVAFLLSENNQVIRKLVDGRDLLEGSFHGMTYDRMAVIQLVLSTVLEKVVLNSSVSKTSKARLFNGKVLASLGNLFKWKGPTRHKNKFKKDQTVDQVVDSPSPEVSERVIEIAHHFLLELCTSFGHGIIFKDSTLGLSARNNNQTVTTFLVNLTFKHKHALVTDLVVKSLAACPDQIQFYVPNFGHKLEPQLSDVWVDYMDLIYQLYSSLPTEPPILQMKEHRTVEQIVDMLLLYTCPPPQFKAVLMPGFKKNSIVLNHVLLKAMHVFAERAVKILSLINADDESCLSQQKWTPEERREIAALYKKSVLQSLPEPRVIYDCLDVALKVKSEPDLKKLKDLTKADEADHDVRIVQTFCVYQELFPSILVDNHFVLTRLIDRIVQQGSDDNFLPQVYLLKLLAGTDARRLPWGKQNKQGCSLMYQLLEMVSKLASTESVKDISLQLISKLLGKTGLFDGFEEELPVWIRPLQSQNGSSADVSYLLGFISGVLTSYMSNPYPYMDRMGDLLSEVALQSSDSVGQSTLDNEEKFKAVVAMEIDDLDDDDDEEEMVKSSPVILSANKRFPFCPVLLVAHEVFKKNEDSSGDIRPYLSQVVLDVFHQQVDPTAMCLHLQKWAPEDLLEGIQTYILTWLKPTEGERSKESPKKKKKRKDSTSSEPLTIQRYGELVHVNTMLRQEQIDGLDYVRQQLLHLSYVLAHSESGDDPIVKVNTVIQNIQESIEETTALEDQKMETDSMSEQLPVVLETDRIPVSTCCVQTVLIHPIIMENFLCENADTATSDNLGRIRKILTDLVIHLLEIVNNKGLAVTGQIIEFYNEKVINLLQAIAKFKDDKLQDVLPSIYRYLKFITPNLQAEKCVDILNYILSVPISGTKTEVFEVLASLMTKLEASSVRQFRTNETNINHLITWCLETGSIEQVDCLAAFFKMFPTLSVMCPNALFASVLEVEGCTTLATVLLQNNTRLQTSLEGWIKDGGEAVKIPTHIPIILELLKIQFAKHPEGDTKIPGVVDGVRKMVNPFILQIAGLDNTEGLNAVFEIFKLLLKMEAFDKRFVGKLETKVLATLRHKDTSILQAHHIQMADQLLHSPLTALDSNVNHRLLQIGLEGMTNLFSKRKHRNDSLEAELLDVLSRIPKEEMLNFPSTWDVFTESWPMFVNQSLKYLYTNPKLIGFLAKFVSVVYADSADVGVTVETMVTMVMNHTSFLPVMFNEESEDCKGAIVDLLTELLRLSPSCCESPHVVIYLGAYGATLSLTDQKILKLLQFYENHGIDFYGFRPYIWGQKAIEFQMLHPKDKLSLFNMKMGKILDCIDMERMQQTILNFPLTLRLQHQDPVEAEKYRGISTTYDPCFFLSLFSYLLAPDKYVECKRFIDSDCLGLVFASLSSHDKTLRSAAYHVLDRFQVHLQAAKFQGQEELVYLLTLLRNSLTEPVSKLAPLITTFLAKAARLLFQPGNHMYTVIKSFLMAKPTLDIFDIPEFYKLFNSSDVEHKMERSWILTLMQEGLREIADFRIFEKRYSFKVLLSFYDTETADADSQIKVLQIVKLACKDRTMSGSLCNDHGILPWIGTAIAKLSPEKMRHIAELVDILHGLWFTMFGKLETSADKNGHLEAIFTSHMLNLSQAILWQIRDVKQEVVRVHMRTLLSVVKHLNLIVTRFRAGETTLAPSSLTYADLLILLIYQQRVEKSDTAVKPILNVLESIGYNTSMLQKERAEHSKDRTTLKPRELTESVIHDTNTKEENDQVNVSQTDDVSDGGKSKVKIEDEISQGLLMLIVNEKCLEGDSTREELLAGSMILLDWVVERFVKGHNSDMLLDGLGFIHGLWTRNSALASIVCSQSNLGSHIITGLLKLYSVIHSKHVKHSNECVKNLNAILMDAAEKKFGSKIRQQTVGSEDEVSLLLKQTFVTQSDTSVVDEGTPELLKAKTKTSVRKQQRKRSGGFLGTEAVSDKYTKIEKPVSKELTGVSQIVEKLHLESGLDQGDADVTVKKTPDGRKRKVSHKDNVASPIKKVKNDTPKSSKKSLIATKQI